MEAESPSYLGALVTADLQALGILVDLPKGKRGQTRVQGATLSPRRLARQSDQRGSLPVNHNTFLFMRDQQIIVPKCNS